MATQYRPNPPQPGAYVMLQVSDDGCGMNEDVKEQIFDPFFTTKLTGRGLGLSAALGIVRSHRGAISVESGEGEGSRFTVVLPALPGAVPFA
jgi:two-component system, cell cycle sensor histidine kinase and response regulator CckA